MSGFEDDFGEMVESKNQCDAKVATVDSTANLRSMEQQGLVKDKPISDEILMQDIITPHMSAKKNKEEPSVLREWREQQIEKLKTKDEKEEEEKDLMKEMASKELDEWYRQLAETLEKTRLSNRQARLSVDRSYISVIEDLEPGTEWER